jgi:integrase/recombinase XerD
MTREELSQEEYRLSRIIINSEEDFNRKNPSFETDLEAYYQKLFQLEPIPTPATKETAQITTLEELRSQALNDALEKLSSLEIDGREHIEEYLRHQYRCFFQGATIRGSYNALSYFIKFISESGRHSIKEIDRTDLESYVEHEQDRGMSLSTVKLRLGIVKAFLRFIIDRGIVDESVFPWKLKIKTPEALPRAMDPDDVDRLLAVKASTRDRAMIMLLLRTGMRIGELLRIRVSDVNMGEQKILIYEGEKNQRGRVVYFSDDAKMAVAAWMKERKQGMELLFYGPKGKVLSYPAARMMFVKYLEEAGLSQKSYTLHCLRHTYATDLINARMPLECLEKLLGHSRLDVTRRYAVLTDKTREEEYFKAMAVIERREKDGSYECDRELQTLLEKTQRLPSHSEELYEHP